ncbi:MAG: PQQ-binding-like beta-propeller repeat protein [Candidatus Hydrogenedentota bacterium]
MKREGISRRRFLEVTMAGAATAALAGTHLRRTSADACEEGQAEEAQQILAASGVQGGIAVHVGCGDGALTAALGEDPRFLVHGLDTNPARVSATRALLHGRGVYGPVSAEAFDGRELPYASNSVNLLAAEKLGEVSMEEVRRVLAPGGVACVREGGAWRKKIVQPWPEEIDEWTHFLHDADGNAVASDSRVAPPQRLQWMAGPRWARSHEIPTSVNAVVSAQGRVFMIFDEGPTGVYRKLPWDAHLIARDAFNGKLLWKVPMRDWQPELGVEHGRGDRWQMHHTIPRRLIAQGDRVYVTLTFLDSPVSVLDAATGEILVEALAGTEGTDEMLLEDGVLIAKIPQVLSHGATARFGRDVPHDSLVAVDVSTGEQLWRKERVRMIPYALSAAEGKVVYHDLEELVGLELRSGEECWRSPDKVGVTLGARSTLLLSGGLALFHGHLRVNEEEQLYLRAFSLDDGERLWKREGGLGQAGAATQPTDLFVINGVVWCNGSLEGYDAHTGEVAQTVSVGELISPGHHYRCHRSKATERFLSGRDLDYPAGV